MKRPGIIILISSAVIASAFFFLIRSRFSMPSSESNSKSMLKAIAEPSTGPYSETSTSLVGLAKIGPQELLVASSDKGIYVYSTGSGWKVPEELSKVGKVASVNDLGGKILISLESGKLLELQGSVVDKSEEIGVTFKKIIRCGENVIGMSLDNIFKISKNRDSASKFESPVSRMQTIACHEDIILAGTDGAGILECSIKEEKCHNFIPDLPSNHVTAIKWLEGEKTWLVGLYGDADYSVIKLRNSNWVPLGSRVGDVVEFTDISGSKIPAVITESGYLFKFEQKDFKRAEIEALVTPPGVELTDKEFFAFSYKALIQVDGFKTSKNLGSPVILGNLVPDRQIGNSYIWDILTLPQGVVYSATSQAGVWWSSDEGRSWDPLNNGLSDPKIHFLKFDDTRNKLIAGGHSRGLFTCQLPCKKWDQVRDPRLTDADLQGIAKFSDSEYLIASEHGAFIYDIEQNKIIEHIPLFLEGSKGVSDLWTLNKIDGHFYFGVYTKPGRAMGVWELKDKKFEQVADIKYPVTGIEKIGDSFLVGTIQGLFRCVNRDCKKISPLSINRMTVLEKFLWLSTPEGVARLEIDRLDSKPKWLVKTSAQMIKFLPEDPSVALIGTTNQGVVRVRLE